MATVLWAAGFILNAALFFILMYRRRYRDLPWFTAFIAAGCVYTIALYLGYRYGSKHVYAFIYWTCDFVDMLLQIAVVFEIARILLKRSGRWIEGAGFRLTVMGVGAPVVAAVMALTMKPAVKTRMDEINARASLFTTILVFVLFVAVVVASHQLGTGWRTYAMRVGSGLVTWVSVGFITDTLHAYWRTLGHFALLENIHIVAFQLVTLLWCVAFWLPERGSRPATDIEKRRLESIQRRIEYGQY